MDGMQRSVVAGLVGVVCAIGAAPARAGGSGTGDAVPPAAPAALSAARGVHWPEVAPVLGAPLVAVPISHETGRTVVSAWINGRGPYVLALQTASEVPLRLAPSVLAELGLSSRDPSLGDAHVARLELGAAVFRDVRVESDGEPLVAPFGQPRVAGRIGLTLFRGLLLTIDWPGGQLLLREAGDEVQPSRGTELALGRGARVDVEVGERVLPARLDSSLADNLLVPHALLADVELLPRRDGAAPAPAGGSAHLRPAARLARTLHFAGRRFVSLPVVLGADGAELVIGHGMLSHWRVSFDLGRGRVRFELPEGTAEGAGPSAAQSTGVSDA